MVVIREEMRGVVGGEPHPGLSAALIREGVQDMDVGESVPPLCVA